MRRDVLIISDSESACQQGVPCLDFLSILGTAKLTLSWYIAPTLLPVPQEFLLPVQGETMDLLMESCKCWPWKTITCYKSQKHTVNKRSWILVPGEDSQGGGPWMCSNSTRAARDRGMMWRDHFHISTQHHCDSMTHSIVSHIHMTHIPNVS